MFFPVLIQQGINEFQTIANLTGSRSKLQNVVNSNAVNRTGFSNPSEFKEFLEFMKWKQCESCRNVDSPYWDDRNDELPYYCQDCK